MSRNPKACVGHRHIHFFHVRLTPTAHANTYGYVKCIAGGTVLTPTGYVFGYSFCLTSTPVSHFYIFLKS
jgi:hypothetical protein